MRVKLASKALLGVFGINLIFIVLLVPLFYYFNDKYTNAIIHSNNDTSLILRDSIQKSYRDMTMDSMKMLSTTTAYSVGQFLTANKLTRVQMVNDPIFQKMSVRPFYHTGYTIVIDPIDYIVISHPNKEFTGVHLHEIQNFSNAAYQAIVAALDSAKNSEVGMPLIYDFANKEGDFHEKYAYLTKVPVKTLDGKTLVVMATMYVDDYAKKTDGVTRLLFQKTNENTSIMQTNSEWFVFAILFTVLSICVISVIISLFFAKKYTDRITALSDACRKIADGDFVTRVPNTKTNDELQDLSETIEYLRENINKQAVIIKEEIKKNEEKNKELGEALMMAEEKTKQLMGQGINKI